MKNFSILSVLALLAFTRFVQAQDNIFLDRTYWKANPSIEKIETDIAAGNDITALTTSMFDGVCYAIMEKTDNATIKHLLTKKGNEVDKLTHDGRTYIFWAAYRDNLEILQHLAENGAKANIEDSHGYSVLNFAAVTGQTNPKLYDFLLTHKADIQATNHDGANALLLVAPFAKDLKLFEYFANKGLSMKSVDKDGNGLFNYAAKGGNVAVLKALVAQGIPHKIVNEKGGNAIFMASSGTRGKQNTLETFQYLESLGIVPNSKEKNGNTPLHTISFRTKDLKIYDYFIEKGLDVNAQNDEGRSPFMNAAYRNSLEVVHHLQEKVDDINTKDEKGRSALSLAVHRNEVAVVDFLLEKRADIHTKDKKGNTLAYYLMQTYSSKKPEAFERKLKSLQTKGLQLTDTQHNGNTLLHLAVMENNLNLLTRLEEFKLPVNKKNDEGYTALHLAAMSGKDPSLLHYLIENGADKSLKTEFEETVYDLVSENELLKGQLAQMDYLK